MRQTLESSTRSHKRVLSSVIPYLKQRRILYGCGIVLIILIIAAVITFMNIDRDRFLLYRQNVEVIPHQGKLYIAVNDTVLDNVIHAEKCQKFCTSIDGSIAAFLTETKELYIVQELQLKKIADDVLHFEISSSGMGVAFAQKYAQQYALTLYDLKEDTRKEITALLTSLDFSLSPDGQSLAYYTKANDQEVLMYHGKSGEHIISKKQTDLVGLSNDGKQIYAICPKTAEKSALYTFNQRGKSTELGDITSMSCKFNDSHQQIMFYNNGKTMISINGRSAEIASDHPLYLVTAPNSRSSSDGNSITLPVSSLFDHVYTCSDGESTSAWLIRQNSEKSKKLISRVSACTLDANFEYLYYIHNMQQLCVMNISDSNPRSHVLAENVNTYVVRSDRSKVYYTQDGSLYCTNGKKTGKPRLIAKDTASYNLVMSQSDVLYYLSENNLFACKNGRKGHLAIKSIQSFYGSPNGVVYIIGEDGVHATYNKKRPVKILEAA